MEIRCSRFILFPIFALLSFRLPAHAQSWSSCNPLTQGGCPADPALGKSVNIDFTQGASNSFSASGSPSYNSNGAAFSVAKSGDSPTISSRWYIMFGHVDFVVKAAPGTGIVSSAILQSDCLDEIDFEWLGGDNSQVQSNYFGKGQTVTGYNRGAFHGAANNHDQFHTYSIDWTANQIVWQVDGVTVRVLSQSEADPGQYPQTPMTIKVGVWAGGDPSNAQGTIQWAGGQTDYTKGPYTMYLKSIHVTDYSTGSSYSYSGTAGTWQSIRSNGGTINSSGKNSPSVASAPAVSTASGAPIPFSTSPEQSSIYATRTGYPWVIASASVVTTSSAVQTSYSGLPSGWIITDSGRVLPPSTGSILSPSVSFSADSVSGSLLGSVGVEVITTYKQQGLPTLTTITAATAGLAHSKEISSMESRMSTDASSTSASQASGNKTHKGFAGATATTSVASGTTATDATKSASSSSSLSASPQAVSANAAKSYHQKHYFWSFMGGVLGHFLA